MAATIPTNGLGVDAGLDIAGGNLTFTTADKGVHLGVTSATASNLIHDYEEGTWTPTLGDSSGNNFTLNSSYSSFGYYTKMGRMVHAHCYIVSSAIGSASGSCLLGGLPFTNTNNNRAFTAGTISAINNANLGDGKSASYYLRPNQTSGFMFNHNNADGGNTMSAAEVSANGEFMMTISYTVS